MFNTLLIILILIYLLYCNNESKIQESLEYNNNLQIHQIYIINLNKDGKRLDYIKKQCNQANILNYIRYPAIDGESLNIENLQTRNILKLNKKSFFNHNTNKRNSLYNSIGCALSHTNLWNKISKTINQNILILEDDIIIPPKFNKLLNELSIPQNWDIIFLGGSRIYGSFINSNIVKANTSNNVLYNCGLFAYIINSKSASKIIKLCSPISTYIDVQLNRHFNKLNCYYVYPNLIKHNYNMESTRLNNNYKYSNTFIQKANKITIT